MTLAQPQDWIVLELPPNIDRRAIERLARQRRGVVHDAIPENYGSQYVVVVDPSKHQLPTPATIVDRARLRSEFYLGASLDECVLALREGSTLPDPWYRWHRVISVLDGCRDEDLPALIEETERGFGSLADVERYIPRGWLDEAVQGDSRRASVCRKLWFDDSSEATLTALKWLSSDPARLPLLRIMDVSVRNESVAGIAELAAHRSIELLALRGDEQALRSIISALGPGCTGVSLDYGPENGSLLEALVHTPAWNGLKRLSTYKSLGKTKGLELLVTTPKPVALTALNVGYCHLDKVQFERLIASPILAGVKNFDAKYNDGRTTLAKLVATSPFFTDIEELDLGANEIGDPGFNAIAKSAAWPKLHTLSVCGNHKKPLISEKGVANFVKNKSFTSLRSLDIQLNILGDAGFAALMQASHLPALQELNVQFCHITSGAAERLAGLKNVLRPRAVKLYGNLIGKGGFGVVPKPGSTDQYDGGAWKHAYWLSNVQRLELGSCNLETDDLADISHSQTLSAVKALDIGSNYSLGNDAIQILAHSPLGARIKTLSMLWVGVSDGISHIIKNSPMGEGLELIEMSVRGQSEGELQRLREAFGARLRLT